MKNNQFNLIIHKIQLSLTMLTISQGRYNFLILGIHDFLTAPSFIFSTIFACVKS